MFFLHSGCGWHASQCALYVLLWAAERHLEPVSGTPQSTRRSRSSRTLPRGSGGDTCPRPPAREGRREESGSRRDTDLQPGWPASSPKIRPSLNTVDTFRCIHVQCIHPTTPLTLSVHMSTHLSTDMFWMTALKGSARVTLSGLWKHPLKIALPSETDRTTQHVIYWCKEEINIMKILQFYGEWAKLPSDSWASWRDPTGTLPVSRGPDLPASTSPLCVGDLLISEHNSGRMDRPWITTAEENCFFQRKFLILL